MGGKGSRRSTRCTACSASTSAARASARDRAYAAYVAAAGRASHALRDVDGDCRACAAATGDVAGRCCERRHRSPCESSPKRTPHASTFTAGCSSRPTASSSAAAARARDCRNAHWAVSGSGDRNGRRPGADAWSFPRPVRARREHRRAPRPVRRAGPELGTAADRSARAPARQVSLFHRARSQRVSRTPARCGSIT